MPDVTPPPDRVNLAPGAACTAAFGQAIGATRIQFRRALFSMRRWQCRDCRCMHGAAKPTGSNGLAQGLI